MDNIKIYILIFITTLYLLIIALNYDIAKIKKHIKALEQRVTILENKNETQCILHAR